LAIVLLLSLVDYALWNWSLGAGHDLVALAAGLTLIPLLIALAWLVLVSATRLVGEAMRRARASAATRTGAAGSIRRRTGGSTVSVAGALRNGALRKTAEPPSAREQRTAAPSTGDGEAAAAAAAQSSQLAA
jgi:hypothetical protein